MGEREQQSYRDKGSITYILFVPISSNGSSALLKTGEDGVVKGGGREKGERSCILKMRSIGMAGGGGVLQAW